MSERFTLTLVPVGDEPPVEQRIRRLLKLAMRACRLRCVAVEEVGKRIDPQQKGKT